MEQVKQYGKTLLSGVAAGLFIGLGSLAFIACMAYGGEAGKNYGSFAFAVGLFMVCFFGVNLYTGKIGFLFDHKPRYLLDLLIMLIGNAIGAISFGYLVYGIIVNCASTTMIDTAKNICNGRMICLDGGVGESWYRSLLLAIVCGMLVFLAVKIYRDAKNDGVKIFGLVMCVFTFVVTGSEHCIADMAYFSMASLWSVESFLNILLGILGNSIGALLVYWILRLVQEKAPTSLEKKS